MEKEILEALVASGLCMVLISLMCCVVAIMRSSKPVYTKLPSKEPPTYEDSMRVV